jgi:hypothetical protein
LAEHRAYATHGDREAVPFPFAEAGCHFGRPWEGRAFTRVARILLILGSLQGFDNNDDDKRFFE